MKFFKNIWIPAAVLLLSAGFTSCNDDDEYFDPEYSDTEITVTKVFLEDPESSVPDREVTFARLGQTLRLEGSGFMGLKKVYVNGYDTYFNRAYVTDNSMIVSLNSKTPIIDADDEVRNTIRLVKDNTETVYEFIIRAATPTITSISNTLPQAGETVTVYGTGLQETTKLTLPGGIEVTDITSDNVDGEWYSFTMPSGVTEAGCIYSEGANGFAQTPDYFNNSNCMIINFDGIGTQGSWGSSNKDDDGNIKAGVSMVYPEDLVNDPLGTGRGLCFQVVPERLLNEGGIVSGKPRATECWTAGNDDTADDWTRMFDYIPGDTPLTDVALQFDVYTDGPWTATGQLEIVMINNYNFAGVGSDDDNSKGMTAFFVPYIQNGEIVPFKVDNWTTVTIPFSEFAKYKAALADDELAVKPTFQNVVDDRNAASYRNFGMGFVNTDFELGGVEIVSSLFNGPRIYTDNWRVVPCKTTTISDYPEDEEVDE